MLPSCRRSAYGYPYRWGDSVYSRAGFTASVDVESYLRSIRGPVRIEIERRVVGEVPLAFSAFCERTSENFPSETVRKGLRATLGACIWPYTEAKMGRRAPFLWP